jgi:hypothetical protein
MTDTVGMTPRGKKMPQTPAEFQYLMDLMEQKLLVRDKEISRMHNQINRMRQKALRYKK